MQLLVSLVLAVGSWYFTNHVLVAFQIKDAASHSRPRGNLSDLYPRWLGARELLLRGRDPYSPAITQEIQQGYYGRVLDASRPNDPKDQAAFAYPVYVVFLIAPTIGMTFSRVQILFTIFLWILTITSVFLWLRLIRWRVHPLLFLSFLALTVGSLQFVQAIKLQQLTLLVAALVAGCFAAIASGFFATAGVLLALATIKPQLALLPSVFLIAWCCVRWRERWRFSASFLFTLAILILAAEFVLPDWIGRFVIAIRSYQAYTGSESLLVTLLAPVLGRIVDHLFCAIGVLLCGILLKSENKHREFAASACLVLSLVVVLVPTVALYNQILLSPALLLLAQRTVTMWKRSAIERVLLVLTAFTFLWPFVACSVLAVASLYFSADVVEALWREPFYGTFVLPLVVFATVAFHLTLNIKNRTAPS